MFEVEHWSSCRFLMATERVSSLENLSTTSFDKTMLSKTTDVGSEAENVSVTKELGPRSTVHRTQSESGE